MLNERVDIGIVDFIGERPQQLLTRLTGFVLFDRFQQFRRDGIELEKADRVVVTAINGQENGLFWLGVYGQFGRRY